MSEDKPHTPPINPPENRFKGATSEKGKYRTAVIEKYLETKWGDPLPACPYCRITDWTIDPVPVLLPRVGAPNPSFGVPVFLIYCENCGNQVFVGADELGLWDELESITLEELGIRPPQTKAPE